MLRVTKVVDGVADTVGTLCTSPSGPDVTAAVGFLGDELTHVADPGAAVGNQWLNGSATSSATSPDGVPDASGESSAAERNPPQP